MNQIKILTITISGILISSCNKVADMPIGSNKIEITSTKMDTVKGTWAVITSSAKIGEQGMIFDHGFCWGTTPLPDLSGLHTSLGALQNNNQFSLKLTGLLPSTKYYSRAYLKNNYSLIFGTQREFNTDTLTSPQIITNDVTDITSTAVICGGNVIDDGNGTVLMRGVCWNTITNPTLINCMNRSKDGKGVGTFTSQITGLQKGTIYYISSYATNEIDTSYGEMKTFSTLIADYPTVTTISVSSIYDNSAVCGGIVVSNGGANITEQGICWSKNQNPTINDFHTSDENGWSSFECKITNLEPSTQYYVRSYATNITGTGYGNEVNFTTLEAQPYHIGDSYGGGIIFFIDDTRLHGLIAAPNDQSAGAPWGCINTTIGSTSTEIGSGQSNTTLIVNGCGTSNIAARICNNLVLNGYSDWFLPSEKELNHMYLQKAIIGGFSDTYYWCSSEVNAEAASIKYFGYSSPYNADYKDQTNYVRAIRAF
ncbi:MAG: hypothetical protein EOM90_14330 [Alphaproteobacteria bacterium]|nr:hypothetical protein [Alphaproteobacteria bacterium]